MGRNCQYSKCLSSSFITLFSLSYAPAPCVDSTARGEQMELGALSEASNLLLCNSFVIFSPLSRLLNPHFKVDVLFTTDPLPILCKTLGVFHISNSSRSNFSIDL